MRPTLSTIRTSLPTATYDTIRRERAITDARAAAARRLELYRSGRGQSLIRELCGGTLPNWRPESVTTIATCDGEVIAP